MTALSLYDGRDWLGALVQRRGCVDAFDCNGVHLGSFESVKAASAAIVNNSRLVPRVRDQRDRGGGDGS